MTSDDAPSTSLAHLLDDLFSYHGSMLLAGVVSLLLAILFTLLLHIFGRRCVLRHLPRRSSNSASPYYLDASRFQSFTALTFLDADSTQKGLDPSAVASIPVFVYDEKRSSFSGLELECAVCLSGFGDGEVGRRLPSCGHAFHVECIDMWLSTHFSCPICRSVVVFSNDKKSNANLKPSSESNDDVSVPLSPQTAQNVIVSVSGSLAGSDIV
uniref:RING-type E3 ubiquitin transferase n=1 Tax=Kalanchoe fedtschenkoi TaxID=63787 RepID=A0A7N0VJ51_KALFE